MTSPVRRILSWSQSWPGQGITTYSRAHPAHILTFPDHVLQRLLSRREHLHQEEVEEQQAEARPAGPGGGRSCSHSQVKISGRETVRQFPLVTSGSSRELRRGERRKMIWRRKDRPGRRQTQCRSSGNILTFFFYIVIYTIIQLGIR